MIFFSRLSQCSLVFKSNTNVTHSLHQWTCSLQKILFVQKPSIVSVSLTGPWLMHTVRKVAPLFTEVLSQNKVNLKVQGVIMRGQLA